MGDDSGRATDPRSLVAHLYPALAGEQGRVLEDGSEAARPWDARHHAELPDPVHVVMGVDPLRVPGRLRGTGGTGPRRNKMMDEQPLPS
jgi:hypothetical protein